MHWDVLFLQLNRAFECDTQIVCIFLVVMSKFNISNMIKLIAMQLNVYNFEVI